MRVMETVNGQKYFVMRNTAYLQKKPHYQLQRETYKAIAIHTKHWIERKFEVGLKRFEWMNKHEGDNYLIPAIRKRPQEDVDMEI